MSNLFDFASVKEKQKSNVHKEVSMERRVHVFIDFHSTALERFSHRGMYDFCTKHRSDHRIKHQVMSHIAAVCDTGDYQKSTD